MNKEDMKKTDIVTFTGGETREGRLLRVAKKGNWALVAVRVSLNDVVKCEAKPIKEKKVPRVRTILTSTVKDPESF